MQLLFYFVLKVQAGSRKNRIGCLIISFSTIPANLLAYADRRVQKYISSKEVDDRLAELKEDVSKNPDKLFVLIFDEAHSGCTMSTKKQSVSPYSKIVNFWNSNDHPNVFVIMVSGDFC